MIQMQLPDEMLKYITDIKKVREANAEPTSNKSIAIDALKAYHKTVCPTVKA